MTKPIMLDLETYDTADTAVVLSIGAVRFDEFGIYDQFYMVMGALEQREDQISRGRTTSPSTIAFWDSQPEAARQILIPGLHQCAPIHVLSEFIRYVKATQVRGVWGNAPTFDNNIMRSIFRSYNLECPWHFRDDRDYRTLKSLTRIAPPKREGTHHNALDDAIYQAQFAAVIAQRLRISLAEPF